MGRSSAPGDASPLADRAWRITAIMVGGWAAIFIGIVVGFHLWAPQVVRQFQEVLANTNDNTLVFDSEDKLLATVAGTEDRHTVPISRISPYLQKAVVAVEDRRFFNHRGMDPIRLFGALWANVRSMAYAQGGSTITQQLVKLSLLSSERTLSRKIREIFMAAALEMEYPKLKVLEFYLNRVYLGYGLYGVEKASRAYFGKPAETLTLAEAAFLAALIKKPEGYLEFDESIPRADPGLIPVRELDELRQRRHFVLDALDELGWVSSQEITQAITEPLVVRKPASEIDKAPYFVNAAIKELRKLLDISRIAGRGYRVYTTLHQGQQRTAERLISGLAAEGSEASQGALVAMEARTGYVRALVGGVNFAESEFNRATQAMRQPGSAFKPIIYAAALEQGFRANQTMIDEPVRYVWGHKGLTKLHGDTLLMRDDFEPAGIGALFNGDEVIDLYEPRNYNDAYGARDWRAGPDAPRERRMTLARALERSSNVIAVQLLEEVGILPVVRLSAHWDITVRPRMGLCIALGCSETTLLELTSAYGSFANGGVRARPVFIRKVTNPEGDVLFQHYPDPPEQVISPWTAFQMANMLSDVIRHGTGHRAAIPGPVGGKTGTNDGPRDAWFVGFTPELVAGVWIGNDDNRPMPHETGGRTPAGLWRRFMLAARDGEAAEDFPRPEEGHVLVRTCPVTGDVANAWCPSPRSYAYRPGEAPHRVCEAHPGDILATTGNRAAPEPGLPAPPPHPFTTTLEQSFQSAAQAIQQ